MFAVFPTILAVLLALSFQGYYAETAMPEERLIWLLLTLPLMFVPAALAELLFLHSRRRFEMGRPFDAQRYARVIAALPLPLYAVAMFVFGWPKIVVPLGIENVVLVDHLVVLSPYLIGLVVALVESTRLKRPLKLTERGPKPATIADVKGPVSDALRQVGIMLLPPFGLIVVLDLCRDTGLRLYFENLPILASSVLLVTLAAMALVYPMLFRIGFGLKPLLAGAPLRIRLEEVARRLSFRCRDVLYWPTRRPVLNAAIVGVLPRFRYVILTEELCKRLSLEEIAAVFAHEVGHGKRHHALFYLLFAVSFLTALVPIASWAGVAAERWSDGRIDASIGELGFVYLPAFAVFWLVLFSWLSRRFELEADVYGVDATADPPLFINTLEKVARISRIERRTAAHRHFSIAGRSDFLRAAFVTGDHALLDRFRNKIRLIRRVILIGAAVVLGCAGLVLVLDSFRGAGAIFLEKGDPDRAESVLRTVRFIDRGAPETLALLSEADQMRHPDVAGDDENWRGVLAQSEALSDAERAGLVDILLSGWARATARRQHDLAIRFVGRAAVIAGEGRSRSGGRVDSSLTAEFVARSDVSKAVERGDRHFLKDLVDDPPRWLRRADHSPALDFLKSFADEHK